MSQWQRVRRSGLVVLLLAVFLVAACGQQAAQEPQGPAETPEQPGEALEPLTIQFYSYTNPRPYNAVGVQLAEAIQAQLAAIGVEARITDLGWTEYKEAIMAKKEGDMFLFGWIGDNGDPDNFLYVHFDSSQIDGGLNNMGYHNPQVDELLREAQRTMDEDERYSLYKEAQEIIVKDAPWVFISSALDMAATRDTISGFALHPTGRIWLGDVEKSDGDTLIYARGADSISLDPALIVDGESSKVLNNINEGLVRYVEGGTQVEPALATSWEVSDDGKVWTFHLREGVKFHDGTPFNADAVVWNIERQLPPNATEDMAYAGFTFEPVEKVEKVDDLTVRITLKNPFSPFLANLAMGLAAPIISPTAYEQYGDKYGQEAAVGTGPFKFVSWERDSQIVLEANEDYWGGAPKVDRVVFRVIKENAARANELIAGNVDIIDGIDPADVERLKGETGINFLQAPGMNINYLGFRTDRPPFDNPKVREAISRAIDRNALMALYAGTAEVANGPLPSNLFGYVPSLTPYEYDPARAVELLHEAGYQAELK